MPVDRVQLDAYMPINERRIDSKIDTFYQSLKSDLETIITIINYVKDFYYKLLDYLPDIDSVKVISLVLLCLFVFFLTIYILKRINILNRIRTFLLLVFFRTFFFRTENFNNLSSSRNSTGSSENAATTATTSTTATAAESSNNKSNNIKRESMPAHENNKPTTSSQV